MQARRMNKMMGVVFGVSLVVMVGQLGLLGQGRLPQPIIWER
jgi:hypothetical protein